MRAIVALWLGAWGVGLGFQAPSLEPRASSPSGTALILGDVVDALTSRPISDVIVTISGIGLRASTRMADAEGRFVFSDLPSGSFLLTASKPGWIGGTYGRLRPNGLGQSIELADGERVRGARILLWRAAAITGEVMNEFGEPIVAAEVRALRRTNVNGIPRLVTAATGQSDDRGVYRLETLKPGKYIVVLVPATRTSTAEQKSDGLLTTWMHPVTFYPAAGTAAGATVLELKTAEERTGIDLQVVGVRAVSVSGRVIGPAGPIVNALPGLRLDDIGTDAPLTSGRFSSYWDGSFAFFGVTPGRYILSSAPTANPQGPAPLPLSFNRLPTALTATTPLWGSMTIDVGNTDVTNVTLELRGAVTVAGRVEFDGPPPSEDVLRQMPIVLEGTSPQTLSSSHSLGPINADGRFSRGLPPGKYFVRLTTRLNGWALETAMTAGIDAADEPLDLTRSGVADLVIKLTTRLGEIAGVVTDSGSPTPNATVIVFPTDPAQWRELGSGPRRMRTARVDSRARYQIADLPAGSYCVVAIAEEAMVDDVDRELLEQLSRGAMRVDLQDREARSLILPLTTVR